MAGASCENIHAFMTTLFTAIIMAAFVTMVNSVCIAAMVADITGDFLLTVVTKVTCVCWLPWSHKSTRSVPLACVSYLVCVIFPCLHTLTFRENG
jgi:hypothetical protein